MNKYLAIDIGGSFIKFSQVDHSGNLHSSDKEKTPSSLDDLKMIIGNLIKEMRQDIKGVGISCPGRVDVKTGIVYNGGALPFLHEFHFKEFIESTFDIPCAIINDGKAAALSELWLGNLKNIDNGAAIVLGTGVGGGIIVNGEILQGSHFQAGELSFMPKQVGNGEMANYLGFSASAVGLVRKAARLLSLSDLDDGKTVFESINNQENQEVQGLFEEYCQEIVHIILNLQAILDIEKVVIGGGISVQPILIEMINKQYHFIRNQAELIPKSFEAVTIEACKFGNEANLLGAIYQLLLNLEK